MRATTSVLTSVLIGVFAALAPAQDRVVTKQERATRAFERLTERMQKLTSQLESTDPDQAQLISLGSRFIQEEAITSKMEAIEEMLADESWDDAIETSDAVIVDLNTLIELLLRGDARLEDLLAEMARLDAFKQRVEDLVEQQQAEKDDSARREALEEQRRDLEAAKQKLAALIADQKSAHAKASAAGVKAQAGEAAAMAKAEGDLKDRAAEMSKELEDIEARAAELDAPQPAESAEPGEPGEAAGGGQPAGGGSAGSKAASGASGDMGKAENKLKDNRPESSLEDMEKAIAKLEDAQKSVEKKLEELKRELLKLPFDQLAKKQEQTKIETDQLAEDMEKSESGEDGQGQPTPGRQAVQQAVPKQRAAAGQLKEMKAGKAKQDQQDAKEQLERAREQLEEALAQLRQQLQEEVLRSLEERLGLMLDEQKKITASTRLIHSQKQDSLAPGNTVSAVLTRRTEADAAAELELSAEAHAALKLLEEDGTTAVFPEFVIEIRDDLNNIGIRLQDGKTGVTTQGMQEEVEVMLTLLIDSLRKQIEENQGQGGPPDPFGGEPPLVPRSAELKLILKLQTRVHERTVTYDNTVPEPERTTEEAVDNAAEIAKKEARVKELTNKLADKINKLEQAKKDKKDG